MDNSLFNLLTVSSIVCMIVTFILLVILVVRIFIKFSNKNKKFPRKNLIAVVIGGLIVSVFFANWIFNPNFLPEGYMSKKILSPDGHYEARVYNYSGFIDYKNVRVEVFNTYSNKAKTIYYNFVDGPLDVNWIDGETVKIESKILNVEKDTYDYRKET